MEFFGPFFQRFSLETQVLGLDGEGFQLSVHNSITGRELQDMVVERLTKVGAGPGGDNLIIVQRRMKIQASKKITTIYYVYIYIYEL